MALPPPSSTLLLLQVLSASIFLVLAEITCPGGVQPICPPQPGPGKWPGQMPGPGPGMPVVSDNSTASPAACPGACNPHANKCDPTTAPSCIYPDPRVAKPRAACACRPGYKATGHANNDATKHWRVPVKDQEHRVWVAEGVPCDTLCDTPYGVNSCREVTLLPGQCIGQTSGNGPSSPPLDMNAAAMAPYVMKVEATPNLTTYVVQDGEIFGDKTLVFPFAHPDNETMGKKANSSEGLMGDVAESMGHAMRTYLSQHGISDEDMSALVNESVPVLASAAQLIFKPGNQTAAATRDEDAEQFEFAALEEDGEEEGEEERDEEAEVREGEEDEEEPGTPENRKRGWWRDKVGNGKGGIKVGNPLEKLGNKIGDLKGGIKIDDPLKKVGDQIGDLKGGIKVGNPLEKVGDQIGDLKGGIKIGNPLGKIGDFKGGMKVGNPFKGKFKIKNPLKGKLRIPSLSEVTSHVIDETERQVKLRFEAYKKLIGDLGRTDAVCSYFAYNSLLMYKIESNAVAFRSAGPSIDITRDQMFFLHPVYGSYPEDEGLKCHYNIGKESWETYAAITFNRDMYFTQSIATIWGKPWVKASAFRDTTQTLVHEVRHTLQYKDLGFSRTAFGLKYLYQFCKAGWSYNQIEFERNARQWEHLADGLLNDEAGYAFFEYWRLRQLFDTMGYPVERNITPTKGASEEGEFFELRFSEGGVLQGGVKAGAPRCSPCFRVLSPLAVAIRQMSEACTQNEASSPYCPAYHQKWKELQTDFECVPELARTPMVSNDGKWQWCE